VDFANQLAPQSPGMVILAISRDSEDICGLLGAHKWSEFLKDPSDEEKGQTSKVFFSTKSCTRELEGPGISLVFMHGVPYALVLTTVLQGGSA